jgi:hypothetical protein
VRTNTRPTAILRRFDTAALLLGPGHGVKIKITIKPIHPNGSARNIYVSIIFYPAIRNTLTTLLPLRERNVPGRASLSAKE